MGFYVNGVTFPSGYLHNFLPYVKNKLNEYKETNVWKDRYYTYEQYVQLLTDCEADV